MTEPTRNNRGTAVSGQDCKLLAEQATDCLLDFLYKNPVALATDSAVFLEELEALWRLYGVSSEEVWRELKARIDLSEDLLKRGIRARKGGRYKSTKLP